MQYLQHLGLLYTKPKFPQNHRVFVTHPRLCHTFGVSADVVLSPPQQGIGQPQAALGWSLPTGSRASPQLTVLPGPNSLPRRSSIWLCVEATDLRACDVQNLLPPSLSQLITICTSAACKSCWAALPSGFTANQVLCTPVLSPAREYTRVLSHCRAAPPRVSGQAQTRQIEKERRN